MPRPAPASWPDRAARLAGQLRERASLSVCAALLALALFLAGALIWFVPFLRHAEDPVSETVTPPPLLSVSEFAVPAHQQLCVSYVAVTPNSRLIEFRPRPDPATPKGGSPLEVTLSAPGYAAHARLAGGYAGGGVQLPIDPPPER